MAMVVGRSDPCDVRVLPSECAGMAARVPGLPVLAVACLADAVGHFAGGQALPVAEPADLPIINGAAPCLSDVRGQLLARRALEIAAAGGHSLLMSGPPGTGKSMLAHRLPGLLPPLGPEQALEAAALAGLSGREQVVSSLPPFR